MPRSYNRFSRKAPDRRTEGRTNERTDELINEQTDQRTDERTDGHGSICNVGGPKVALKMAIFFLEQQLFSSPFVEKSPENV